jgi:Ribonuclease G/E
MESSRNSASTALGIVNSANQNASKYAGDVNQANRETGDRMAAISVQQGKEAAGAAYAAAGTSIAGQRSAMVLNNQATRVGLSGRIAGAEITQKTAIESAKLQAISMIMSRMGSKLAQDIEKGMEMRY